MNVTDCLQKEYDIIHGNILNLYDSLHLQDPVNFKKNMILNHLQSQRDVDKAITNHKDGTKEYKYIDASREKQTENKFNQKNSNYRRNTAGYYERIMGLDYIVAICKASGLTPTQVIGNIESDANNINCIMVDSLAEAIKFIKKGVSDKKYILSLFEKALEIDDYNLKMLGNFEFKTKLLFKLIDFIEVIHTEEKILSRDRPGESEIVLSFFSDDFFLEETEDEHDKRIEEFIQYMIENCSNDYEKRIYGCYLLDIGMCYWDISFEGGNIIEAKNFEGKTLNLLNDSDSINSTIGRTLLSTVSLAIMDTVNNCSKEKNITISEYFELNKDIYEFFCDSINKSMERKNQSSVLLCSEVDILREDEDYEWNDDLNRKDLVERERKEKIELDERVKNAYNSMKR